MKRQFQKGMSLAMIMISAGLISGISLAIMQIVENSSKAQKAVQNRSDTGYYFSDLRGLISKEEICKKSFQGQNIGPKSIPIYKGIVGNEKIMMAPQSTEHNILLKEVSLSIFSGPIPTGNLFRYIMNVKVKIDVIDTKKSFGGNSIRKEFPLTFLSDNQGVIQTCYGSDQPDIVPAISCSNNDIIIFKDGGFACKTPEIRSYTTLELPCPLRNLGALGNLFAYPGTQICATELLLPNQVIRTIPQVQSAPINMNGKFYEFDYKAKSTGKLKIEASIPVVAQNNKSKQMADFMAKGFNLFSQLYNYKDTLNFFPYLVQIAITPKVGGPLVLLGQGIALNASSPDFFVTGEQNSIHVQTNVVKDAEYKVSLYIHQPKMLPLVDYLDYLWVGSLRVGAYDAKGFVNVIEY